MTDHYSVLPPDTEKLLLRLISLYKEHGDNETLYRAWLSEISRNAGPHLNSNIKTLVDSRYLQDDDLCIPTDIGYSYKHIKRLHYIHAYAIPAVVAIAVSAITTLINLLNELL